MNAIEHGAGNDPTKTMTVRHIRSAGALLYSVADPGKGFSFDKLAHAAVSNPLEGPIDHVERRSQMGMRSGGFGILMTRSLVDEMVYNEAGNEVRADQVFAIKLDDARWCPSPSAPSSRTGT